MDYETIAYDVQDRVLTITLSRPEKLNAYNAQMMAELIDAFDRSDADDGIRAVVITGEGRGFCAGADLSAGAVTFDYEKRTDRAQFESPVRADGSIDYAKDGVRDSGGRLTLRIFQSLKPVIAAINGPAVGIGATMLLPMDIRLASTSARIGFVFARRGIVPEAASSWFLPRVVGINQALEWCMTGRVFDAEEALAGGLVRSVHAPGDLLPAAYAIAAEIADNTAPVSVALVRQMMWRGLTMDEPMEAHRIDSRGIFARGRSADVREGVTSFIEKRPAVFPDKVSTDMPDYFPWWTDRPYS